MLAHKAHAEFKVAVEVIAQQRSVYDVRAMPAKVFTDPELAWVGVTEEEAKTKGLGRRSRLGLPLGRQRQSHRHRPHRRHEQSIRG